MPWCGITGPLSNTRNPKTPIPHIIMLIKAIHAGFLIFILTLNGSTVLKMGFYVPTIRGCQFKTTFAELMPP
jgi:hypothetical protein